MEEKEVEDTHKHLCFPFADVENNRWLGKCVICGKIFEGECGENEKGGKKDERRNKRYEGTIQMPRVW